MRFTLTGAIMSDENGLEPSAPEVEGQNNRKPDAEPELFADSQDAGLDALMSNVDSSIALAGEGVLDQEFTAKLDKNIPTSTNTLGEERMPDLGISNNNEQFELPPLGFSDQSSEDFERERMKLLVSHFDEQQMSRYAAFRRANIRRTAVKKYASQLLNQPISNSVAVVLAGMSKVLIGDIIELARDLQERNQALERRKMGLPVTPQNVQAEPLHPSFIREAWRIYKEETGTVPGSALKAGSGSRFF